MRRMAIALTLVAMLSLVHAREVLGGGPSAGTPPPATSGPAISATIVFDPTWGSPTLGQTSVRLSKGTNFSGATFAAQPDGVPANAPWPQGWHRGCDGEHGVDAAAVLSGLFTIGTDTVAALTDRRFLGKSLFSWIPADVVTALFVGPNVDSPGISGPSLGIPLGPLDNPVIIDIDNPVCTAAGTWLTEDLSVFGKKKGNGDGICDPGEICVVHQKYIVSFTAVIGLEKK